MGSGSAGGFGTFQFLDKLNTNIMNVKDFAEFWDVIQK
jgi:hypothetical protein